MLGIAVPENHRLHWQSGGVLLLLFFALLPFFIHAATIEELKTGIEQKNAEIRRLEEEAKKFRDEITAKQQTGKTLKQELTRIQQSIKQLNREITVAEKKIEGKRLEISETALEIREREESIGKFRRGLSGLLFSLSESDRQELTEILLRYGLLSDFIRHLDYSSLLEGKLLGSLATLRELKNELESKKTLAEKQKGDLENLEDSFRDKKKIQEDTHRDRNNLLAATKNQEKRYQELLRETERKQEAVLRDIEELEDELRKLVDPASLPQERKGLLLWPAEGKLSQGYGETPFTQSTRGRHFYKFHNGIDIANAVGTPVVTVDGGTVTATGDTDRYCPRGAYGKYIVIKHENNLATMYAHLSLIKVVSGQKVERGDIIGYMGRSGLSTGSHLHFTLYDARTVEIRKGNIGTCGLLPFGGSINPLVYL